MSKRILLIILVAALLLAAVLLLRTLSFHSKQITVEAVPLYKIDEAAIQQAANYLLGEHDFTSFRAAQCQALSPVKNMLAITIHRRGAYWRIEFEANAFLHHMIRNIMGCLVTIGQGKKPADWLLDVLAARDRKVAAPTFSPDGLYFLGPRYDAHWGIPDRTPAYDALP